ncbi:hypothetical protein X975_08223, partial [Stegodyphus mimosarum]
MISAFWPHLATGRLRPPLRQPPEKVAALPGHCRPEDKRPCSLLAPKWRCCLPDLKASRTRKNLRRGRTTFPERVRERGEREAGRQTDGVHSCDRI